MVPGSITEYEFSPDSITVNGRSRLRIIESAIGYRPDRRFDTDSLRRRVVDPPRAKHSNCGAGVFTPAAGIRC
jgi:hypothetical protein